MANSSSLPQLQQLGPYTSQGWPLGHGSCRMAVWVEKLLLSRDQRGREWGGEQRELGAYPRPQHPSNSVQNTTSTKSEWQENLSELRASA